MNAALKESLYDSYQKDHNAIKPEVQDLSYIFRCFDTGDDEEYQLIEIGSSDQLRTDYWKAIDSLEGKKVPLLKEAINLWYKSSHYLIKTLLSEFILDQLKPEIWHHGLFEKDYFVWDSIVLGFNYNDYLENIS